MDRLYSEILLLASIHTPDQLLGLGRLAMDRMAGRGRAVSRHSPHSALHAEVLRDDDL